MNVRAPTTLDSKCPQPLKSSSRAYKAPGKSAGFTSSDPLFPHSQLRPATNKSKICWVICLFSVCQKVLEFANRKTPTKQNKQYKSNIQYMTRDYLLGV